MNGNAGYEKSRVGFVLFVSLAVLVAGLYVVAFKPTVLGDMIKYKSYFSEIFGLRRGAPVVLGGVPAGTVEEIGFTDRRLRKTGKKQIEIVLFVKRKFADQIREDSVCSIETKGLLGEKVLAVDLGSPGASPIKRGGVIPSKERGDLQEAITTAGAGVQSTAAEAVLVLRELRMLLKDVRAKKGVLGKLIYSDEFYNDTFDRVDAVIGKFNEELERLSRTLNSEIAQLGEKTSESMAGLKEELTRTGKGIRKASAEVQKAAAQVGSLTGQIRNGKGPAGTLFADEDVAASLRRTVQNLEAGSEHLASVAQKIDEGEGTVGKFLNEPDAYTSLRDVFEGVQQSWLLQSAVTSAERRGRELRLKRWEEEKQEDREKKEEVQ